MRRMLAVGLSCLLLAGGVQAASDAESAIRQYVEAQPGAGGVKVDVQVRPSLKKIPACSNPVEVRAAQRRLAGPVNFSLRCGAPAWSASVSARIVLNGEYWVADRYLPAGTLLVASDIKKVEGDLAGLPDDVVRSENGAVGRVLSRSLPAGSALTLNALRESAVIKAGERVRVNALGTGFSVVGEATAMSGGAVGESIKLKMPDGQSVSGLVLRPGLVEVHLD